MDCVKSYGEYLKQHNIFSDDELNQIEEHVVQTVTEVTKLAVFAGSSRRASAARFIETVMFSNQKIDKFDDREPEVLIPQEENPRVKAPGKETAFCIQSKWQALFHNAIVHLSRRVIRSHAASFL